MHVIVAAIAASAALTANNQTVTARAYGCDFTGAASISIFVQNERIFGSAGNEIVVPATVLADHSLQFVFQLPPGPFDISYSVGKTCYSGGGGLIVLPGHDRHVVLWMYPSLFVTDWHNRRFFAGTLPPFGLSVSVVIMNQDGCPSSSSPETAAAIDDGAYYVSYLSGRHAFLKLRSASLDGALYIALTDASSLNPNNQLVVRNITIDDVRALTTHKLNDYERCIPEPSGVSSPFDEDQHHH